MSNQKFNQSALKRALLNNIMLHNYNASSNEKLFRQINKILQFHHFDSINL